MSTIHGEIEFEFRGDEEGGGEFLACGKVLHSLMMLLANDKVDEAAELLAACAENMGDELLEEMTQGGASRRIMASMARMFFRANDFGRAAICAQKIGDFEMAAQFLEANYDLVHAAEYYLKASKLDKAGALFERNLNFERAAEIYLQMRDYTRAAENLERAGNHFRAGQLYFKMSRWDRAMEELQRVPAENPHFPDAGLWLGHMLEKSGNRQMAMQQYLEVVRDRPVSNQTLEIYLRLARICDERGQKQQAIDLVKQMLAFNPKHEGTRELAVKLGLSAPGDQHGEDIIIDVEGEPVDMTSEVVMELKNSLPRIKRVDRLVAVDRDFEFLRRVPLFARLSLDELKYVQSMCEKVTFSAGRHLIRQGRPGEMLYVLVRGKVEVSSTRPGGKRTKLGELGPGAHVGEMALLDDAPTSADIVAVEQVLAFCLRRHRFQELLQGNERIQLGIYSVMVNTLAKRLREANVKLAEVSK